MPAVRCTVPGAVVAQRPNAPSTCTHAPAACARSQISGKGSKAPVLTLPAWTQTTVGPEIGGSASARILPCASTGTLTTLLRPSPRSPNDLNSVGCASAPTTTVIIGAPKSPSASTFQPTRWSNTLRAAASAEKLAIVAPVTKAPPDCGGNLKRSSSHPRAISSSRAVAGVGA